MPVRSFDGVTDKIVLGGTGNAIGGGDYTVIMLAYPFDVIADRAFIGLQNGTSTLISSLIDGGVGFSGRLGTNTNTTFALGDVGLTANGWQWLAMRRQAGGSNPIRYSRRKLGEGGWTHSTSSQLIDDNSAICDRIELGAFLNGAFLSPKHTLIATVAIYETYFADVDLESVDGEMSNQYLYDLGATVLVPLDQDSTSDPAVDVVGDADQIGITGTTVVTDNDPPGFDPAVTVVPSLEFSLRLSGGAANTDPAVSIGGAESSQEVTSGLFDDVNNTQRTSGIVDYRLLYVHNEDDADGAVIAYVSPQLEAGRELALGVPTEAAGDTVDAIDDDETSPAGVSFEAPATAAAGVDLGTVEAGSFRGLWLRRTVNSGTVIDPTNSAVVRFEATRTE